MAKTVAAPNLEKILSGLGVTRARAVAAGDSVSAARTATSFGSNIRASRTPQGPTIADIQALSPARIPDVSAGSDALPWKPTLGDAPRESDDGLFGDVMGVLGTVIDVVDTPRAFVTSLAKETVDTVIGSRVGEWMYDAGQALGFGDGWSDKDLAEARKRLGSGSWDDLWSQTDRNIGFREVWDAAYDTKGNHSNWFYKIAGVAGDIILDPLTYIGMGTGVAARAGDGAADGLRAAIQDGGRKQISKALAEEALSKGLKGEAVDTLIADAARRGRGALTRGRLGKMGTEGVARELGMTERFGLVVGKHGQGLALPGTSFVADATESLKGAIKETLGRGRAARIVRDMRFAPEFGERQLLGLARSGADVSTRAEAVRALVTVNERTGAMAHFGAQMVREVKNSDWAKQIRSMEGDASARLVDAIESGVDDPLAKSVSSWLTKVRAKAVELGVKIGWQDNYVPHILTDEARKLARRNHEFRGLVDSLMKEEAFQKARTVEGTIAQINAKSMSKYGVKMFDDDIETIVTKYITQAADAVGRQAQKDGLKRMGVASLKETVTEVSSLAERPDLLERIKVADATRRAALGAEADALDSAAAIRRQQIDIARQVVDDQRRNVASKLGKLQKAVKDAEAKVATAQAAADLARTKAEAAKSVYDEARKVAQKSRSKLTRAARRKLNELESKMAEASSEALRLENEHKNLLDGFDFAGVAEDHNLGLDLGVKGYEESSKAANSAMQMLADEYSSLSKYHDELKVANTPLGEAAGEEAVAKANASLTAAVADANGKLDAVDLATHSFDVMAADAATITPIYEDFLNRLDTFMSDVTNHKRRIKQRAAMMERAHLLRARSAESMKMMKYVGRNDVADLFARQNMLADMLDIQAVEAATDVSDMNILIDQLKDPKFREHTALRVSEGYKALDDTHQIPGWLDDILKFEPNVRDSGWWDDAARYFDRVQNLWKGYAIARPGFVVRNAYSSLFNVYLEAGVGAADSVAKFHKFYKIFKKDPENYMAAALKVFKDPALVDKMDLALKTVAATGGGLAHEEFQVGLVHGLSANPFSRDFAPIKAIRHGSEEVEALVRGGHALSVLQRGGSYDLAVDTVTKWHFNYRDITQFDRNMKRVIPFWTFFSRDIALQAQTFPKVLPKLNRTYFNLKRNLEYGEQPDRNVPNYDRLSIRLPGGDSNSNIGYLPLDLPAVKFQQFVGDTISRPTSIISNASPFVKMPMELMTGQQFYNGQEFANANSQFRNGVRQPRGAPWYAQIPGLSNVLGATNVTNTYADGTQTMTDRTQYIIESLFPTLAQSRRATKDANGALSWLTGVAPRYNTPDMRAAKDRRREALLAAQEAARRDLGW